MDWEGFSYLSFGLVAVGVIALGIYAYQQEKKWKVALQALATFKTGKKHDDPHDNSNSPMIFS